MPQGGYILGRDIHLEYCAGITLVLNVIPKLGARAGGIFGLAFAVVGGGIQHVRKHAGEASRAQAELRALNELLAQHQQQIQTLLAHVQSTQNSEAVALQQAAAAESSNAQLTLLAQDHQRIVQELSDSRKAAAVPHQQALQALREAKDLVEGARGEAVRRADEAEANLEAHRSLQDSSEKEHNKALQELTASKNRAEEARDNVMKQLTESRNILEQTQLSHNVVVQGLQRQLHDALEGPTAAEEAVQRHLAAEQEGRMAVSKDLVAAQREMEGLVQRNHQLEHVNASMGEEALRVQVEQEEMRARFEAQSAELTSLKAQMERMSRDASDAAQVQQQLQQQVQDKERLLGEANDATKQLQAELGAQAAEKQWAISDLQEQVARLQDQVARAQVGPSSAAAQEEVAARLQREVGVLQRQLSAEHNLVVEAQEEGRKLLQRAELADGQVYHLETEKLNLSTKLVDLQQQLPALQTQLESSAGREQSARETAERLGGRVDTLQGAEAELKCQLEQQSKQLSSQAAELVSTTLQLQESQVACKALEKAQGRAEGLRQQLQAAEAARQVAEGKVVETTQKLAASEQQLKVVNKKKEGISSRKAELQQENSEWEGRVGALNEQLEAAVMQLKEETGQNRYLDNQVKVLKIQLVSAGLEPASVEQADDNQDAVFLPEVDTTATEGKEDIEVMSPQSLEQGNASNVVEVLRPRAKDDSSKSRQGNASNVVEVPRARAK
ncbi:hypothetical protein WJX82_007750 [Trebouxia sp. C0006]